jgi:hypothetical protein
MPKEKTLEELFSSSIGKAIRPELILTSLITRRLSELGITLSAKNVAALKSRLKIRGNDELLIEIDDEGYPGLSNAEVRERVESVLKKLGPAVKKVCDQVLKSVPSLMNECVTTLAGRQLDAMRDTRQAALKAHRTAHSGFKKHLRDHWGDALNALEVHIGAITEIGMRYCKQNDRGIDRSGRRVREVLMLLHARACQISKEILSLLSDGFADGAHARWRSLHEVGVVACFIATRGERVACRYIAHELTESRKGARASLATWPQLAFDNRFSAQLAVLERGRARLVTKYGASFAGQYGWAAHLFKGGQPTFVDIERAVQLQMLRPHFGMANYNVHASAKGALFRLGLGIPQDRVLLAGPSALGLSDPGLLTAYSLMQITTTLLTYKPSIERLALARVVMRLGDEAIAAFKANPDFGNG